MAPGLIDPTRANEGEKLKPLVGPKDAFDGGPKLFNKVAEETGTKTQPPATYPHYLPIWDAEKKSVALRLNTST